MNTKALTNSLKFIDSWLQFRYDYSELPGYSVAIAHKGKIVFSKAYGYANLETKTTLTPSHIFRIASHSKTFTATALMQLQEAGKLHIDDHVTDYLPWLKQHKDKRWQNVTLRQVMSHGAGIFRDGMAGDFWQLERPFPNHEELKQEVLSANLVLDNNIKLKYSNFGYGLLGMVVEAVSGQPYNEYVAQHIVKKLGLKSTGPEYTTAIDGKLVTGYTMRESNGTRLPFDHIDTRALSSATGFYSTTEDLCTYFSAHMIGSNRLLSDESKKEMQRVHYPTYSADGKTKDSYGLGLDLYDVEKRTLIGHGGGFPGQITNSKFDQKDELAVVALTNSLDGPASTITTSIYGILNYYQKNTPSTKSKYDLHNLAGRYFNLWGVVDIVVTGDKIVGITAATWQPFAQPETLERIDDTTFKIVNADSFGSEGELVQFKMKAGNVESMTYAGKTRWPEEAWAKKQAGRKAISL